MKCNSGISNTRTVWSNVDLETLSHRLQSYIKKKNPLSLPLKSDINIVYLLLCKHTVRDRSAYETESVCVWFDVIREAKSIIHKSTNAPNNSKRFIRNWCKRDLNDGSFCLGARCSPPLLNIKNRKFSFINLFEVEFFKCGSIYIPLCVQNFYSLTGVAVSLALLKIASIFIDIKIKRQKTSTKNKLILFAPTIILCRILH